MNHTKHNFVCFNYEYQYIKMLQLRKYEIINLWALVDFNTIVI